MVEHDYTYGVNEVAPKRKAQLCHPRGSLIVCRVTDKGSPSLPDPQTLCAGVSFSLARYRANVIILDPYDTTQDLLVQVLKRLAQDFEAPGAR